LGLVTGSLWIVLAGCEATYLLKQGYYQVALLAQRRPLDKALEDDSLSETVRRKMRLVRDACLFAEKNLNLNCGDSYSTFIPVEAESLAYSVVACPKDSLSPLTWSFPLVGSFPYKGFFRLEDALGEARKLEAENYDVHVGRISAFSALGWFSDPIYSTMLHLDETELVYTILHELVHKTIFFKDKGEFNEQIATFIGWKGTLLFYEKTEGPGSKSSMKIAAAIEAEKALSELLEKTKAELEEVYKGPLSLSEKLGLKEAAFSRLSREILRLSRIFPEGRLRGLENIAWNNASFLAIWLYRYDVGDLEALWDERRRDLRELVETLKGWRREGLDPQEEIVKWRRSRLAAQEGFGICRSVGAGDDAKGGFLGGTHSVRPQMQAGRKPGHNMIIGGKRTPGGLAAICPGEANAFLAGVRSPPLRGGQAGEKAYRGKARDDAEGGFLGGTHSVRPPIRAGRKPGHNMIIGGKRTPGGQMGTCSGEANSVVAGVRSPPLRGGASGGKGLPGKGSR
jgi:predicted aminopeptidase